MDDLMRLEAEDIRASPLFSLAGSDSGFPAAGDSGSPAAGDSGSPAAGGSGSPAAADESARRS
jgi:hypothetical protein